MPKTAVVHVDPTNIIENKLSGDFLVEKAKPLTIMQNMPFSLGELKILDTYLSRINARDESHRTVRFSVEEYENLMGVSRMRTERLNKYVDAMMGKLVTIENPDNPNEWRKFVLFGSSRCYRDENKQWWIELTCTDEAKNLFFSLEKSGYFRYYLSNVTTLSSIYTYYLYIYLVKNDFRGTWKEDVESIKKVLNCTSEAYNDFRYFKRDVLEKALREVNAKTNVSYKMDPVKEGRRIVAIQFTREKGPPDLPKDAETPVQNSEKSTEPEENHDQTVEKKYKNESLHLIATACNCEFSEEEMLVIRDVLLIRMPHSEGYDEIDWYHQLKRKYNDLNLRESQMKVKGEVMKNRFSYLKTMLDADVCPPHFR